ncbi:MAG: hypothetical protein HYY09_02625 [Firmicutes bacterium]|nr:hypothetical protein [Bacillota bacterium]
MLSVLALVVLDRFPWPSGAAGAITAEAITAEAITAGTVERRLVTEPGGSVPGPAISRDERDEKVVLVLVADGVSVVEMLRYVWPVVKDWTGAGNGAGAGAAAGLMNQNSAGRRNAENAAVTIGAGNWALGVSSPDTGLEPWEPVAGTRAGVMFRQRTGNEVPLGGVGHLGIGQLVRVNGSLGYPVFPGNLGSILEDAEIGVGVLGNGDQGGRVERAAVSMAMNTKGVVRFGEVGPSLLSPGEDEPFGVTTDVDRLLEAYDRLRASVQVVFVEFGDPGRAEAARPLSLEDTYRSQKERALRKLAQVTAALLEREKDNRLLFTFVVLSPPEEAARSGRILTPAVAAGPGIGSGLLTSASTRRPGIVLNVDLPATILSFFDLERSSWMEGRPLAGRTDGSDDPAGTLVALEQAVAATYRNRPPLIKGYVLAQMGLVIFTLFSLFTGADLRRTLIPTALSLLLVPVSFLILSWLGPLPLPQAALVVVGAAIGLNQLIRLAARGLFDQFFLAGSLTALVLVVDTMAGSPLQKGSILGYDPIAGARFYGMGNEYMGVLVGAAILALGAWWQRSGTRNPELMIAGGTVLAGILFYLFASPRLGANLGGAITAAAAVLTFLLSGVLSERRRISPLFRTAMAGGGLLAISLTLILLNSAVPAGEGGSHVGKALDRLMQGDWTSLLGIGRRKAEMNLKLIRYSIWSRVFLTLLGGLAILFYRPVGLFRRLLAAYPAFGRAMLAVTVAAVAAFLANDSGVVAAATTLMYGAVPLLALLLEERKSLELSRPS